MAKGLFGTVVRTISTDCWGISDLDLMRSGFNTRQSMAGFSSPRTVPCMCMIPSFLVVKPVNIGPSCHVLTLAMNGGGTKLR